MKGNEIAHSSVVQNSKHVETVAFFFYEDVRCKKLLFFFIENLFGDLEQIGVESEYTETSCAHTLLLHIIFLSV
jgi:hypothetical protein